MGAVNDVYSKWGNEDEQWTDLYPEDRTLKYCLKKFGFGNLLKDLDENLENVRKHKNDEESHKKMIREYDKKLQKLSLQYHPDHSIGGSADEQKESQNSQAALNSIRTLLTHLSKEFLRDIDIDYKYEYYAKVDISTIGNEEDVDKLNLNLQYQLIMLSEIKHEKIIANIQKFLILSEQSLDHFFKSDTRDFTFCLNQSLSRLDECIEGYETLSKEFGHVLKECAKDFTLQSSLWVVKRMSDEFERQLKNLKKLRDIAKQSLKGNFQIYADNEKVDSYFVLPFVKHVNVLIMCNVVLGNTVRNRSMIAAFKSSGKYPVFNQLDFNDRGRKFFNAYYLALYLFNPSSSNDYIVRLVLNGEKLRTEDLSRICASQFHAIVKNISLDLKTEFKPEQHYIVRSLKKRNQEYDREVKDFFEAVMKRKKHNNTFDVINAQAKRENAGEESVIFSNQAFKYKVERSADKTRNWMSNGDFKEGQEEEGKLLEELRDSYKEMSENLKTKLLENEIRNEKLRGVLEIHKIGETELLERLSIFNEKRSTKLTKEIIKSDEENRKLRDELEIKREEEKLLILKLSDRYEKMSTKLQAEMEELENKKSMEEFKTTDYVVASGTEDVNEPTEEFEKERIKMDILEKEVVNQKKIREMEAERNESENGKEMKTEIPEKEVEDPNSAKAFGRESTCLKISGEGTENVLSGHGFERDSKKKGISENEVGNQTEIQGFERENLGLVVPGSNEGQNQTVVRGFGIPIKDLKISEKDTENRKTTEVERESRSLEISRNETDCEKSTIHECKKDVRLVNISENELKIQKMVNDCKKEIDVVTSVNDAENKTELNEFEWEKASEIETEDKNSVEEFEKQRDEDRKLLERLRNFRKEMKAKVNTEMSAEKC